ncbi:putative EamA domain-containing protein [Medicago truncatula]|uniref:WAT1-related protein n=1 Tax=Medicago truncatula TaxID=3880 RepID=G7K2S7_MEDTR|nr:WAT1-related protein At3g28100 [Medicago truncatula]AES96253.2 nodulin MtN21/EamA-like transporter family protein [Medicago truncatula]RHN55094.1 putative EamA domain-containing protein [Medicago truncatula]
MRGWLNLNGTSKLLPFVGMIISVLAQSGSMVVIKFAMKDGMNKYVMVVYSMGLSSILLLPLALFINRSQRPPLTFSALWSFFLLALIGSSAQIMTYGGIELSSPTLASAMLNLIPAFTFVLALIFRMERIYWRHFSSQAKAIGTIVSMAGAFVVILYKGPPILKIHSSISYNTLQFSPNLNWILGGFLCAGDSLLSSMWYIYQVSVTKKYPAVIVIVFFQVVFITIQTGVYALIVVRDPSAWELKLDMGLIVILYQAVAAIGIRYFLQTWSVQRAGPLFCAMFKPIGIIFTVFLGSIFLGDDFYLGSLIGAVIIVVGFYAVQWGKASEEKVEKGIENLETQSNVVPLLQNKV